MALAGAATEASAQAINWDQTADVVIIGAGVAGLPAAITARELGASVIIVEENYDIGGRGMLSGGRVQLGGGHALQQKFNIKDNADQVFLDWVRADDAESRYSDRELVRVFADENVSAYQFLLDNGVEFIEKPIGPASTPRPWRASSSPRNGTSRPRWWRRAATATARASSAASPRAPARRARRSCSSTR